MRMMRKAALAAGASLAVGLVACSDSSTAPTAPTVKVAPPSFALIAQPTNFPTSPNTITVCSANAGATFAVSFNNAFGTRQIPPLVGAGPVYSLTVAKGACATIWSKGAFTSQPNDDVTTATVVQTDQDDLYQFKMVEVGGELPGNAADNTAQTATLNSNAFHGATATFTQELAPVIEGVCDRYTFGGFVLTPNNISYGGNAGRIIDPPGFAFGSLNFVNHTTGDHIHVWNVTDYGKPADGPLSQYDDARLAFGLGSVNGGPTNVEVEWRFVDLGEPAKKNGDAVYLKVGGVVLIPEQVVQGGNIQFHDKCKKAPKAEKH